MTQIFSIAALALALAATGSRAQAQTPAPAPAATPNFTLPHAYAGYSQPEITQCATTGGLKRECVVPAMTAA